jgi:hypothetical protein
MPRSKKNRNQHFDARKIKKDSANPKKAVTLGPWSRAPGWLLELTVRVWEIRSSYF